MFPSTKLFRRILLRIPVRTSRRIERNVGGGFGRTGASSGHSWRDAQVAARGFFSGGGVEGENFRELKSGEEPPLIKTDEEWYKELGEEAFVILRSAGTEAPGSHPYNFNKKSGVYNCRGCGSPLFESSTKYNSGSGWPSFYDSLPGAVVTRTDRGHGMVRTEIVCGNCHGHLGHVFPDGPEPTHIRHCVNGLSIRFVRDKEDE
mmetsp:Transcript_28922/g.50875  ORF Transcript_28922/g.50875 Transcript_28922/m.50875 type:complete len:204 (-) Transcript_28922:134-745(-)